MGHRDIRAKVFLRNALKRLEETAGGNYDFIFIDCPPNLYLATQNGLFASSYYVVVALAEYLSTVGLAHIQKSITGIFDQANQVLASLSGGSVAAPVLIGIIFNRLRDEGHGTRNEENIIARIRAAYGDVVFTNFVSQSPQIAGRAEEKVPIAFSGYAADLRYESQMRKVAEECYDRITRPHP